MVKELLTQKKESAYLVTNRHYPVHESLRLDVILLNQVAGSYLSAHKGDPVRMRFGLSFAGTIISHDV